MRKGKSSWINIGIVTAVVTSFFGMAYGFWWTQQPKPTTQINRFGTYSPGDRAAIKAMDAARTAHTSNFDNILRF